MDKNLTKAIEALAKYGFAANAERTAGNERAEIVLLSAAKTHLSISTDIPNSEKIDIADDLYAAAKEYGNYFQSLADACDELQNACAVISTEASEEEWRECHTADLMADIQDMLGELDIRE
jgi:hypothetical protein